MAIHPFGCIPHFAGRFRHETTDCTSRRAQRVAPNGSRLGVRACHTSEFDTGFRSTQFTRAVRIRNGISVASDVIADRGEQFHRYL